MTIRSVGWFDDDSGFGQEPRGGNPWLWCVVALLVLGAALAVGGSL